MIFSSVHLFGSYNLEYGIKGGLSLSKLNIYGDDASTYTSKYYKNVYVGLSFHYPFLEDMGIQTGAFYTVKGLDQEWMENSTLNTANIKLEYLEVPLLLKYHFASELKSTPYLLGGIYGAYLLSAKNTVSSQVTDIKRYFKKIDLGVSIGAGFDFTISGTFKVSLEGKYSFSIQDTHKIQDEVLENYHMKNRAFNFLLGFSF